MHLCVKHVWKNNKIDQSAVHFEKIRLKKVKKKKKSFLKIFTTDYNSLKLNKK